MKIVNLPRGAGKTSQAVKMSAELNIPILCANKIDISTMYDRANQFDLTIPKPIAVSELQHLRELPDSVIIDELEFVLQQLLNIIAGKIIGVKMTTISDDDNSHLVCVYRK